MLKKRVSSDDADLLTMRKHRVKAPLGTIVADGGRENNSKQTLLRIYPFFRDDFRDQSSLLLRLNQFTEGFTIVDVVSQRRIASATTLRKQSSSVIANRYSE